MTEFELQQLKINAVEAGLTVRGYLKSGLKSNGFSTKRAFSKSKPVKQVKIPWFSGSKLPF
ncbi:MAG: hypothetical protein PHH77_02300 [Victivallaceae bacterium]|nr:hypothetical protein [Victivallaceae bacterium]MDD5697423.1 hypothetical protein [Victivallaceae bacterium]